MMTAAPERFFPADYRSARRAFIAACEARGLDAIARVVPGASGPDGKPLFMDAVAMGPRDATRALLLIGGTRGVEGAFGSAVQTGLLREGIAPPEGARLVMIHALNPFGFAWNRRVDQDNIDISRNFVDHAAPPANSGYDELADAIAPRDVSDEGLARADAVLATYAGAHGPRALQAAIGAGQYTRPDGLFYGGTAPCWSARALEAVLTEDLARVEELTVIDCHTGLGEAGRGQITAPAAADAFARAVWGNLVAPERADEAHSVPPTGTLDQGLARLLPGVALSFGTLAMGTMPPHDTLRALRLANWQDHFAPDRARSDEIARIMRDAFYINSPARKRAAWNLARTCVMAALTALA